MWMFDKTLDALRSQDLQWLVDTRVRESAILEYKRQPYGGSDGEIRKMLRDVTAMANAEGGVLILGMEEDGDGIAAALTPVAQADVEAPRIVSSCLANVAERIPGLRAVPVPIRPGESVIVIQIPRSHRKPHMITFQGGTEFWIRHDRQQSRMSIAEVRAAVRSTEELELKAERFIEQRRGALGRGSGLRFGLMGTPLLLEEGRVEVGDRSLVALLRDPPTLRPGGHGVALVEPPALIRPTLRGLAALDQHQSLEVFRNGHV
jgi:hypothetical protein